MGEKHPERWERDLNPDHMAGQNIGRDAAMAEHGLRTAYDVKELHRALAELPDDVLKQIPVLPTGARLQEGATYLDLADPARDHRERPDACRVRALPGSQGPRAVSGLEPVAGRGRGMTPARSADGASPLQVHYGQ